MMVMIVRCAGVPAVAVMPASAMTGAENVRRFGHVFEITRVNTRQSNSGTLPSGLPAYCWSGHQIQPAWGPDPAAAS
jgi:hypothetical protein